MTSKADMNAWKQFPLQWEESLMFAAPQGNNSTISKKLSEIKVAENEVR